MVAPVVTTSGGTTAATDLVAGVIDSGLTVTDADSVNLSGATVAITGNFVPIEDQLGFTNQNGITGSFVLATGVLTLSGTATVANYQTALESVTYTDTNGAPSTLPRTITFTATDDTALTSAAAIKTVSLSAAATTPTSTPTSTATPTTADIEAMFAQLTGVPLGDPKVTAPTLTLANGQMIANPLLADSLTAFQLETAFRQGQDTFAQVFEGMLPVAGSTTAVALETYQFFTGAYPTAAGQAYLVNSPANPADLTDPYYYGFNEASRFENFAINLGTGSGPGAASFAQAYSALTFDQAARKAYDTVIGNGNAILAGISVDAAIAYIDSQQGYFQAVGGSDLGAKAAMVGYLMSAGFDARLGNYYESTHDLLASEVTIAGVVAAPGTIPLL